MKTEPSIRSFFCNVLLAIATMLTAILYPGLSDRTFTFQVYNGIVFVAIMALAINAIRKDGIFAMFWFAFLAGVATSGNLLINLMMK